jgi:hypothetical protein
MSQSALQPERCRQPLTLAALLVCAIALASSSHAAFQVEVLRAVGGLPPHVAGSFEEPIGFRQASNGVYLVFDRRAHTVHLVDPDGVGVRRVVDIGQEEGRIIQPSGFDGIPDGSFVVADMPRGQQRIQLFSSTGTRLGGFFLPGRPTARVVIDNLVLNGVGSIQHTGGTLLVSDPESGALFTEYSFSGHPVRHVGQLRERRPGHEPDLHAALNAGLPLVDPTGGYYFVFITGQPVFRKYDADGRLVFERYIQGRELDEYLSAQPTRWPRRRVEDREVPFVAPVIRAAAVDSEGQLWISLGVPYTYVYDTAGEKVRTVQFRAAGIISPTSLSFSHTGRLLVTPGCYEFDPR